MAPALFCLSLLTLSSGARAARWHSHLTLPSGDGVLLRTATRAQLTQVVSSPALIDSLCKR
jgi:hypothetical protein